MAVSRKASARPRRKRSWFPPDRLPRQVRFVAQESTGSFVRRLAVENGWSAQEMWAQLGDGERLFEPEHSEGYLNAAALGRLAALTGRSEAELQWALPNLRPHRLLDAAGGPAWTWPWYATHGFLVRSCELCARTRGVSEEVFLALPQPWTVCLRHRRWMDHRREPGAAVIRLAALPEVLAAHRQRLRLERALGAMGKALFADAYAIVSCWWNVPSLAPAMWEERRRRLPGQGRDSLRIAPLVFYPQAVALAQDLARYERRRQRRSLSEDALAEWLRQMHGRVRDWQMPDLAVEPICGWAELHAPGAVPGHASSPGRGRWRRLPDAVPHTGQPGDELLTERTCLPWKLGELLTDRLRPAPGGWTVAGRA